MGVAIFPPQSCLGVPIESQNCCPMRTHQNPNPNRPKRRKRSSSGTRSTMVTKLPSIPLNMGQVKILKRGEDVNDLVFQKPSDPSSDTKTPKIEVLNESSPIAGDMDSIFCSTNRWGPEPALVPTQIRLPDFYAGSAFITSPPPSSLPLPAFVTPSTDEASSGLRRLLRLDFL